MPETPARRQDVIDAEARAHQHADDIEARAERAMSSVAREIKIEVRWLILASVGLNQLFNNLDLGSAAKAGIAGGAVILAKVAVPFFAR